ncbi:hypothetical protein ABTE07_20990, partial [Acinetobacter baumannii]
VVPASEAAAEVATDSPEPLEVLEELAAPLPLPVAVASAPAIPEPTEEALEVALAAPAVVYLVTLGKTTYELLRPPVAVAKA